MDRDTESDSLNQNSVSSSRVQGQTLLAYACNLLRITYKNKGEIN